MRVQVFEGAHLDLSLAAVKHIKDTSMLPCFHSGVGIVVGDPFTSTGSLTIRYSEVSDYQNAGITVIGEGSNITASHNIIKGVGASAVVFNQGIELVLGSIGTITDNIISGNDCGAPDIGCGRDFLNESQAAGIDGGHAGSVILRNILYGNQVGIYAFGAATINQNVLLNNRYFGIALQDHAYLVEKDLVVGGFGGVAVIASGADTTATLDKVKIVGTSGAPVQKFECCGFSASIIIQ
jgi:hypothetical protein